MQLVDLTLCMLGNYFCVFCRLLTFFFFYKINIFKKLFQEYCQEFQIVWIQIRTDVL